MMPPLRSNKKVKMYVHEDFRNKLKATAAIKGLSILEYTELMGKEEARDFERKIAEQKKKDGLKYGLW